VTFDEISRFSVLGSSVLLFFCSSVLLFSVLLFFCSRFFGSRFFCSSVLGSHSTPSRMIRRIHRRLARLLCYTFLKHCVAMTCDNHTGSGGLMAALRVCASSASRLLHSGPMEE
jgi:hypothetical protein